MPKVIRKKTTTPAPSTTSAPTPTTTTTLNPGVDSYNLGKPKGTIPNDLNIAYGRGAPWKDVTRYNPLFIKYGLLYGVTPEDLQGMTVVESGGQSIPNQNGFPNYGILQLTHSWNGGPETEWEAVGKKLRVDFKSPEGQVAITAYVLGGKNGDKGTPREIFLKKFYPVYDDHGNLCLDCKGQDGHTPRQYLQDVDTLKAISYAAAGKSGTTPAVTTTPAPQPAKMTRQEMADFILGDVQVVSDTFRFNQRNVGQHLYAYGVGHGTQSDESHTGDDLFVPLGTKVYTPLAGVVRCVGAQGQGNWGQGCGSFNDTLTGGVGNVTVLTDAGLKITFGHVNKALVKVGDRVSAGQAVATTGGMFSPHLHLDVSEERNGTYWLLDPIPALIEAVAFGAPVRYAERIAIPQPKEFDVSQVVTANRDGVPVLQRAMLDAQPVRQPLDKGETFEAVYTVLGNDGNWYWISTLGSRVPIAGTSSELLGDR